MSTQDLVGKSLEGFTVEKLTEVFQVNYHGKKESSLGFFKNPKIAKGFASIQTDATFAKIEEALVLTNGEEGFLLGESIKLLNDEEAKLAIAKKARAKLSDEEAEILGIP
jgi:hypothetical protein